MTRPGHLCRTTPAAVSPPGSGLSSAAHTNRLERGSHGSHRSVRHLRVGHRGRLQPLRGAHHAQAAVPVQLRHPVRRRQLAEADVPTARRRTRGAAARQPGRHRRGPAAAAGHQRLVRPELRHPADQAAARPVPAERRAAARARRAPGPAVLADRGGLCRARLPGRPDAGAAPAGALPAVPARRPGGPGQPRPAPRQARRRTPGPAATGQGDHLPHPSAAVLVPHGRRRRPLRGDRSRGRQGRRGQARRPRDRGHRAGGPRGEPRVLPQAADALRPAPPAADRDGGVPLRDPRRTRPDHPLPHHDRPAQPGGRGRHAQALRGRGGRRHE